MEFENLDPKNIRQVAKTAIAYRQTFAGPPWNEVSKCTNDDKFFDLQNPPNSPCPICNNPLKEAYPIIETTRYIRNEISKPKAIAKILEDESVVVAFGWGYKENGEQFAQSKYGEETKDKISQIVRPDKEFFYMSEFGVIPAKQKNPNEKIGSKITLEVAKEARQRGDSLLLRTMKSTKEEPSRMDGIANKKLGMTPIMGGENQPRDPKNPKRILYYKE